MHLREEGRQSFKGQLYESTQQRIKRERAEQERFSQYQTQSSGARYAGLTFGALFSFLLFPQVVTSHQLYL
jgi:D-lactate dehydrogenase (cytochrome)